VGQCLPRLLQLVLRGDRKGLQQTAENRAAKPTADWQALCHILIGAFDHVPRWSIKEHQMNNQRHFRILDRTSQREAEQIGTLINDLGRIVQLLNCDIETEEERAGVSDRSNAAYPILARTLAARRDNLRETMAALERRLVTIKTPLGNAVAA
jgi:hypothetical protein